jgi:hypothetical protein
VKQQRCESEPLIVINDNLKRFARFFFISNGKKGKESKSVERQREHVREAEHCGERKIASAIK